MSETDFLSVILDNAIIAGLVVTVVGGLIVWWLTKAKDKYETTAQISQTQVIEGDNKSVSIGRDVIINRENSDNKIDHMNEERFEKIEQKLDEAEERYDEAIRELNAANRDGVSDEELNDLDEDTCIALDKLIDTWEKAAYYYKLNQIPREKFKVLLKAKFRDFVKDPEVKGQLKENIKWLKKELF